MKTHFKTLSTKSEFLFKDKGSKFIGIAQMCLDEEDVKEKILELKKIHPQATHVCYAYKFGVNQEFTRANDDGEPNNSAGVPILGQIISFGLTNTLIAVVRYYGGTKLGVGGLISAYKNAAKGAIEENEITTEELSSFISFNLNYEEFPFGMKLIKQQKVKVLKQEQNNEVFLKIEVRNSVFDTVKSQLLEFKSFELKSEIRNT